MRRITIFFVVLVVINFTLDAIAAGSLTAIPSTLDFGVVAQGKGHGVLVNIKNNSTTDITCTASVKPTSFFSLVVQSPSGFSNVSSASLLFPASNQKPLDVAFQTGNSAIGTFTQGTLSLTCPGGNSIDVPLRGQTGVELDVSRNGNLTGKIIVTANGSQILTCPSGTCIAVVKQVLAVTLSPDIAANFAGWSNATGPAFSCWGKITPCQFSLNTNTKILGTFGAKR